MYFVCSSAEMIASAFQEHASFYNLLAYPQETNIFPALPYGPLGPRTQVPPTNNHTQRLEKEGEAKPIAVDTNLGSCCAVLRGLHRPAAGL